MKHCIAISFCFFSVLISFAQHKINAKASINHTAIFVIDLHASGNFYQHIIGLDTIPEPFHDGKHIWLKIGDHTMLHIIQGADKKREYYKNQHTCFTVPSIPDFITILQKNNWDWEDRDGAKKAITTRIDGVHQIWLQDPDGYWIEVNDDQY